MKAPSPPWVNPPQRPKKLRTKRAEKQARKADWWGRRIEEARREGPDAVAAVTWDRLRKTLDDLPNDKRTRAYEALTQTIDRFRETHAE